MPENIPGAIRGYWFEGDRPDNDPRDGIPLSMPQYLPTGAVLPRGDHRSSTSTLGELFLDLVRVEDDLGTSLWVPLSEAGRYTWSHTLGLLQNSPWCFVTWEPAGTRRIFDASFAELLPWSEIEGHYGSDASDHARRDRAAVQLRLVLRRDTRPQ